jgi:hypothetical protein
VLQPVWFKRLLEMRLAGRSSSRDFISIGKLGDLLGVRVQDQRIHLISNNSILAVERYLQGICPYLEKKE